MNQQTLVAVVGPNAAGKTSLSLKLAKKFNGEIISADSRQVYRGMDIGTGKATPAEQRLVPHHLLDVADPKREFNVSHFKKLAQKIIHDIQQRGRIPFLVGGTGFWIAAVVDNTEFPAVKPNRALRVRLGKKNAPELFRQLRKLDPARAQRIDRHNPYRLIRAIEIIQATGKKIEPIKKSTPYQALLIGVTHPLPQLYRLINQRLQLRLRAGLVREVARLHRGGISWRRLHEIGLEYRFVSLFLRGKITRGEMESQLENAIRRYAKRQMTWFKRDRRIHWVKNANQAEKLILKFLNQ